MRENDLKKLVKMEDDFLHICKEVGAEPIYTYFPEYLGELEDGFAIEDGVTIEYCCRSEITQKVNHDNLCLQIHYDDTGVGSVLGDFTEIKTARKVAAHLIRHRGTKKVYEKYLDEKGSIQFNVIIDLEKVLNWDAKLLDPYNLKESDFNDIAMQSAHTLSGLRRFWGQTQIPYSVAQHCLSMVEYFNGDVELQKWAIAHEVFEALTGMDVATPQKKKLPEYKIAENKALAMFAKLYDLTPPTPDIIKKVDKGLMVMEALALMKRNPDFDWVEIYGDPVDAKLYKLGASEEEIRNDFIITWQKLFGRL